MINHKISVLYHIIYIALCCMNLYIISYYLDPRRSCPKMCCRSLHKNTPALMNVHPTYNMHFAPHKSFKQGQPGSFLQGFDLPETNLRETVGPRARHG